MKKCSTLLLLGEMQMMTSLRAFFPPQYIGKNYEVWKYQGSEVISQRSYGLVYICGNIN